MADDVRKLPVDAAPVWQATIRELIKHENDLVNQRMGWLIQIQGLLFAALGFAWKAAPASLVFLICTLGVATAVSLWSALALYSPAVRQLRNWWEDRRPDDIVEGPDVIGFWSPCSGIACLLRPWRALPAIFIIAWISVLILSWFYKT
jgi:hypothetical protein